MQRERMTLQTLLIAPTSSHHSPSTARMINHLIDRLCGMCGMWVLSVNTITRLMKPKILNNSFEEFKIRHTRSQLFEKTSLVWECLECSSRACGSTLNEVSQTISGCTCLIELVALKIEVGAAHSTRSPRLHRYKSRLLVLSVPLLRIWLVIATLGNIIDLDVTWYPLFRSRRSLASWDMENAQCFYR